MNQKMITDAEAFRRMKIQTQAHQVDEEKKLIFNFVMTQLQPDPRKRNDPCFCRSGRKYKNCCLKRNNGRRF